MDFAAYAAPETCDTPVLYHSQSSFCDVLIFLNYDLCAFQIDFLDSMFKENDTNQFSVSSKCKLKITLYVAQGSILTIRVEPPPQEGGVSTSKILKGKNETKLEFQREPELLFCTSTKSISAAKIHLLLLSTSKASNVIPKITPHTCSVHHFW